MQNTLKIIKNIILKMLYAENCMTKLGMMHTMNSIPSSTYNLRTLKAQRIYFLANAKRKVKL